VRGAGRFARIVLLRLPKCSTIPVRDIRLIPHRARVTLREVSPRKRFMLFRKFKVVIGMCAQVRWSW